MSVCYRFTDAGVQKRADGSEVIEGILVTYGATADIGGLFRERMLPGSLRFADAIANVLHDRTRPIARTGAGLELIDNDRELRAVIAPVNTRDGQEALELVRAGVLKGLSAEFRVDRSGERQAPDGAREITGAELRGLGVVDRPAYPDSLAKVARRYATDKPRVRAWVL